MTPIEKNIVSSSTISCSLKKEVKTEQITDTFIQTIHKNESFIFFPESETIHTFSEKTNWEDHWFSGFFRPQNEPAPKSTSSFVPALYKPIKPPVIIQKKQPIPYACLAKVNTVAKPVLQKTKSSDLVAKQRWIGF